MKQHFKVPSYPKAEEAKETEVGVQGEGLRLLARMIARIYARDIQGEKRACGTACNCEKTGITTPTCLQQKPGSSRQSTRG